MKTTTDCAASRRDATYTTLADGSWGLRVKGNGLTGFRKPESGAMVNVRKRDGSVKQEAVGSVLSVIGGDMWICSIAKSGASRKPVARPAASRGYGVYVTCQECGQRTLSGDDWCGKCGAGDYER